MDRIVLFGAGEIGRKVAGYYQCRGDRVLFFIDNNQNLWGSCVAGIPVISLDMYGDVKEDHRLIVSCNDKNKGEIFRQLMDRGINIFEDCEEYWNRERIISYSHPHDREDIILYQAAYAAASAKIFFCKQLKK